VLFSIIIIAEIIKKDIHKKKEAQITFQPISDILSVLVDLNLFGSTQ